MMNHKLPERYFARALDQAEKSDVSAALRTVSSALGMLPEDERSWKLAGLCYYQLGNYAMAGYCFDRLTDEREEWQAAALLKQEEMNPVIALVEQGNYKKAAASLAAADKTIGEWNYLGCLYAVLGRREQAAECFTKVLAMDRSNAGAIKYLIGLDQMKKRKWWQLWQ